MKQQAKMNLSLMDEPFEKLRGTFNKIMNASMSVNERQELEGFKIGVNVNFDLHKVSILDELSAAGENRTTIIPKIDFKIVATLQQKFQAKGTLPNDYEIALDDEGENLIFRRIDDGQTSLFDEDTGFEYHVDAAGSVTIDYTEDSDDDG